MKRLISISTILLILLLKFNALAQEKISIQLLPEGQIIIPVTLNDSIKCSFILDTGAGINVISNKIYQRIKNTATEYGFYTGFRHDGDRLDGELYTLPSMSIGNQKARNVSVGVFAPLDNMGIDGLVSLKFFEDKLFSIDYQKQEVQFYTQQAFENYKKDMEEIPIEVIKHGNKSLDILLPFKLNNAISIDAVFDTGSGHDSYYINPYYIEKLGYNRNQLEQIYFKKFISKEENKDWIGTLNSFRLENSSYELKDISIKFRQDLIYEALVGSQIFANSTVAFDIEHKKLYVKK